MSMSNFLKSELTRLIGFSATAPKTVSVSDADGNRVELDVTAVDSLSCSIEELRLTVAALKNMPPDLLEQWAQALSNKITYLLEDIGPVELDPQSGEALIRSTPPQSTANGTAYYEMMLQTAGPNTVRLCRYESIKGQPGRSKVDMTLTHEVVLKLVDDLLDTVPRSGHP